MYKILTRKKEVGQGTGDSQQTKWSEWCEPIRSYEEFIEIRREAREIVDEIRSCDDEERRKELKKKLPAVVYCFPADGNPQGGWLAGSKRPSKLVLFDIDGLEDDELRERVKQVLLQKKDSLRLLFLEQSARKHGYHGAVERIDGLSTMQLFERFDSIIGIEGVVTDKSCKDVTRKTFWTTDREEDLIYCDFNRMLELSQTPAEYIPNETKAKKEKPAKVATAETTSETPVETAKEEATKQSVQIFYDTCKTYGIDLGKLNVEGYRHGIVNDLTGHKWRLFISCSCHSSQPKNKRNLRLRLSGSTVTTPTKAIAAKQTRRYSMQPGHQQQPNNRRLKSPSGKSHHQLYLRSKSCQGLYNSSSSLIQSIFGRHYLLQQR